MKKIRIPYDGKKPSQAMEITSAVVAEVNVAVMRRLPEHEAKDTRQALLDMAVSLCIQAASNVCIATIAPDSMDIDMNEHAVIVNDIVVRMLTVLQHWQNANDPALRN